MTLFFYFVYTLAFFVLIRQSSFGNVLCRRTGRNLRRSGVGRRIDLDQTARAVSRVVALRTAPYLLSVSVLRSFPPHLNAIPSSSLLSQREHISMATPASIQPHAAMRAFPSLPPSPSFSTYETGELLHSRFGVLRWGPTVCYDRARRHAGTDEKK